MLALLTLPSLRRWWRRVLQAYGWKPFAVMALIGLVFANVLDRQANQYDQISRKSDKQTRELQRMKRKVQEQAALESRLEKHQQMLNEVLGKVYVLPTADLAAQQLKTDVEALVPPTKTRITGGSVLPATVGARVSLIQAETQFSGFTQYIFQFLEQTGSLPKKVWISELQLAGNDPNQPSELMGKAVFEALYVPPEKKADDADKSGSKSGKSSDSHRTSRPAGP